MPGDVVVDTGLTATDRMQMDEVGRWAQQLLDSDANKKDDGDTDPTARTSPMRSNAPTNAKMRRGLAAAASPTPPQPSHTQLFPTAGASSSGNQMIRTTIVVVLLLLMVVVYYNADTPAAGGGAQGA